MLARFLRIILRDFVTEVQVLKSSKMPVSPIVDGVSDCTEMADMFADKYDDLYSCVAYDNDEMLALKEKVNTKADDRRDGCR